jgi:UDP-glucose-4-epimerase GalE
MLGYGHLCEVYSKSGKRCALRPDITARHLGRRDRCSRLEDRVNEYERPMSILITGGAGFIGTHSARLLSGVGLNVVVLDKNAGGLREDLRPGTFVQGDIADEALVRATIRDHAVTAVLHLAASAHVGESIDNPDLYFANNVGATYKLINAICAEDVSEFVFASTCAVYGYADTAALLEEATLTPVSPYGESKLQVERALRWYESAYGLRWAALRYFNVAGAEPGLGEDISVSKRIIPRAIRCALNPEIRLSVFGTSFPTPDGTAVRDYVHVSDVARANLEALRYVHGGQSGALLNIASGRGTSVLDIIHAVEKHTGKQVLFDGRPGRPGDPALVVADVSKAKKVIGWKPAESTIDKLITSIIESRFGK